MSLCFPRAASTAGHSPGMVPKSCRSSSSRMQIALSLSLCRSASESGGRCRRNSSVSSMTRSGCFGILATGS
jgi:hypothetical protein